MRATSGDVSLTDAKGAYAQIYGFFQALVSFLVLNVAQSGLENRMKAKWQQRSKELHERFIKLAQAKGSLNSDSEVLNFLSLAICGEAGELANLVKKKWRGDEVDSKLIRDEVADIRIYLEHIARHLRIDLDEVCAAKLNVVADRLDGKEQNTSVCSS